MSDAPERIWVGRWCKGYLSDDDEVVTLDGEAFDFPRRGMDEYIRADIHRAEVERLRAENAELVEALHQLKSEITAEALRMAIEAIGSA
jgi:hypothetical protein